MAVPAAGGGGAPPAAGGAPAAAGSVDIDGGDVLRLIMQFLREQGLDRSLRVLQEETGVALNAVESPDALAADVSAGRWDMVLATVATLRLPPTVLMALYEQIVRELVEGRETEAARSLLKGALPLVLLRQEDAARFSRLEALATRGVYDASEAYPDGKTRERCRGELARLLLAHVSAAPPSRLLALLGQALKWQAHTGQLPAGGKLDLLRGAAPVARVDEDKPVKGTPTPIAIRFGAAARPEAAVYTPDGLSLVVGGGDGVVEVYSAETGKLRKDLAYQAREECMLHDAGVTAVAVSADGLLLASGDATGRVKVWELASGDCLARFPKVHGEGNAVSALAFSRDASVVLSGGQDGVVRLLGLRSGKALRELRGHGAFISSVAVVEAAVPEGALAPAPAGAGAAAAGGAVAPSSAAAASAFDAGVLVVTASADSTVRVWDSRTGECLSAFRPPQPVAMSDCPVLAAVPLPRAGDSVLVLPRGGALHLMSLGGALRRSFPLPAERPSVQLRAACTSPLGRWIYACGDDGRLYAWAAATGALEFAGSSALHANPAAAAAADAAALAAAADALADAARGASGKAKLKDSGSSTAVGGVLGIASHPFKAQLATWGEDGMLRVWRP